MELSLNQATTRPYPLPETARAAGNSGIRHLGVWIEPVEEIGLGAAHNLLRDNGLTVSSVCRAGFVADKHGRDLIAALDGVKRGLEIAHHLGAPMLTFIAGGLPTGDRSIPAAEGRVRDALETLEPFARQAGVRLALEPLLPLFATTRSVVTSIGQALRIIGDLPDDTVGVLLDAYATFWDPDFDAVVAQAGPRIAGYQISDFRLPLPAPENMNGRLFPGDGELDLAALTRSVINAGYTGPIEVEIFNDDIWSLPLRTITDRTVASFTRTIIEPLDADDPTLHELELTR